MHSHEWILRHAIGSMIRGKSAPHCWHSWIKGKGHTGEGSATDPEVQAEHLRQLERSAVCELENMQYATDYAEPGYSNRHGDAGILFANWNVFPRKATDLLERAGYAIEWSDEWSTCDECQKAVRTHADSYSWSASYWMEPEDCHITCHECIREDPSNYIEWLNGNDGAACTIDGIDLAAYGYSKTEDVFESGFHPGQNDDPETIARELQDRGITDFIFEISAVGQFDVHYVVWTKTKNYEVHCDNVGSVYSGHDLREARKTFQEYVRQSESGIGRAAHEDVTLTEDGDQIDEHAGDLQKWSEKTE